MQAKRKTWDVIDRGQVPESAPTILFTCENCGREADLPHTGLPIAQIGSGLIFEGDYTTPVKIRCRGCRRVFENTPTEGR